MFKGIDLYSDTMTRPTVAMRKAMAEAEVGDEQRAEDPTTLRLEALSAEMLGKSAAIFLPSATMANEIAIRFHCRPGEELIAHEQCHLFFAETGGPAAHAGAMLKPLRTPDGIFSGDDVREASTWVKSPTSPVTRLVSVENTTNMGGGVAWPAQALQSVLDAAKELGLRTHLDGARLFNAAVKTGLTPKALASRFDTVTVCFSKGLGCPTGAVLAFDREHFREIRRLKQLMGGAMRQSGILAAAAIHALAHHVDRLREDHANAARLARLLSEDLPCLRVETREPSTNMVYFEWNAAAVPPERFLEDCTSRGLRFSQVGRKRFRAVTHLDIQAGDIDRAVKIIKDVCSQY